MKIGILREGKIPHDRRVAFTPRQIQKVKEQLPNIQFVVQPSPSRVYSDKEFLEHGINLNDDLSECDILFGVKEVPVQNLIPDKTYIFFSHVTKKQEHNKGLLKSILKKNITLIDYELLTDNNQNRIIGFGRYAGLVGAYNGIRALAIRRNLPQLKPAHTLDSLKEMFHEAKKFIMPPVKIAFTGEGRVAGGVKELLLQMAIKEVDVDTFLNTNNFDKACFVQLTPGDYNKHKTLDFNFNHFVQNPEEYSSTFQPFYTTTDLFISSAYWDPKAPKLFSTADMKDPDFRIKIIADISCDIDGAIPSTIRASTIPDPFYGYNVETCSEGEPFGNDKNVTVMAVDNLPNELARDASDDFGNTLITSVIPALINNKDQKMLVDATIAKQGKLTSKYEYLKPWVFE